VRGERGRAGEIAGSCVGGGMLCLMSIRFKVWIVFNEGVYVWMADC
jgi:hypothetical protein